MYSLRSLRISCPRIGWTWSCTLCGLHFRLPWGMIMFNDNRRLASAMPFLLFVLVIMHPIAVRAQSFTLSESSTWTGHDGAVTAIAFAPDGRFIASSGMDHVIKLWIPDRNHEMGTFRGHTGAVWAVTWSSDGQSLVSGSEDRTVKVWNTASRRLSTTLNVSDPVLSVTVSPDRLWLATGSADRKARVWNFRQLKRAEIIPGASDLMSAVLFVPGSNLLVIPKSTRSLTLWDPTLDEPTGSLEGGASPLAVSADGRWLASGSGQDESIRLWDLDRRTLVATFTGHTSLVSSLSFSPDGRLLVSGSWDHTIRVWDIDRQQAITAVREAHPVWAVAFSPDGQWLVAGEGDGQLKRWGVRGVGRPTASGSEPTVPFRPAINENVDRVSVSNTQRPHALGVILGIEDYRYAPDVTFARRDATVMREYFTKTLGLQESNIYIRTDRDATQGEFRKVFDPEQGWLAKRITSDETEIFVYYVGHGTPDVSTGDSYLMPADGDPNYPATSCRLDELYRSLDRLPAKQVTVILDACFSGRVGRGKRVEMLLAGARGIAVEPRRIAVGERTVVLTASAGNQVSSGYPDKSHGLFTYFLMRGLKGEADTDGDRAITVTELYTYVHRHVTAQAGRLDREQTPELHGDDIYRVIVRY